nr:phosphodiester glycosidase family protein [Nocardiopsis mwathae]
MAENAGAVAAVNGGFFVTSGRDGIPGTPAGIGFYAGELASEATNGRVAVVLEGDGLDPLFVELVTELTVAAASAEREIDGINRVPGKIRNCGGVGGDIPTERPKHDFTCTDSDELVLFTPALGVETPDIDGHEVVLDKDDKVVGERVPGGDVPPDGSTIQGIGEGADWLAEHAQRGAELRMTQRIRDTRGRVVRAGPRAGIVNGGPWLVRNGEVEVDLQGDGLIRKNDRSFGYTWAVRRHPRTSMGVDGRSRILLLAAAGRQPGVSDGLGLHEVAATMRKLGARDAVALDGGGSTTMVGGGRVALVGNASSGERAVGDALVLKAGGGR